MKILLTLDFPPEAGGIQRYLYGIVKHTYSAADLVIAGGSEIPRGPATAGKTPVVRVCFPGARRNKKWSLIPLSVRFVRERLRRGSDVVAECGTWYAALIPWAVHFLVPVRYRVYGYGTEIVSLQGNRLKRNLALAIFSGAEEVVVLGEYTAALMSSIGYNRAVTRFPPKIEMPLETKDPRPAAAHHPPLILSVGRLVPHKGHGVLIEALELLCREGILFRAVIAGEGPLKAALLENIAARALSSCVCVRSGLSDNDIAGLYRDATVFVLPSCERPDGVEGFGIVMVEAMARHVPVVASRTGGIPEVLDDGRCGILVVPGDSGALARALWELLGDPLLRRRVAEAAYARARGHYVW